MTKPGDSVRIASTCIASPTPVPSAAYHEAPVAASAVELASAEHYGFTTNMAANTCQIQIRQDPGWRAAIVAPQCGTVGDGSLPYVEIRRLSYGGTFVASSGARMRCCY